MRASASVLTSDTCPVNAFINVYCTRENGSPLLVMAVARTLILHKIKK